jgi:hypothetical protein
VFVVSLVAEAHSRNRPGGLCVSRYAAQPEMERQRQQAGFDPSHTYRKRKLKKRSYASLRGTKVFFTETDSVGQGLYSIDLHRLAMSIKLWVLICDHVVVPASHIFESSVTYDLLRHNPALLESEALVPNLRDECRDYQDFVELKLQERDAGFFSTRSKLREIAAFLDSKVPVAAVWKAENTRDLYFQTFLNDLRDPSSSLRRKLRGERKSALEQFTRSFCELPQMSRLKVFELADMYLERRREVMKRHANLLYYMCGASSLNHVLHPGALKLIRAKYTPLVSSVNLSLGEDALFANYLENAGLSRRLVSLVSIPDLVDLRSTPEGRAFRKKWQKTIGARTKRPPTDVTSNDLDGSRDALQELLRAVIQKEHRIQKTVQHMRTLLAVASFAFGVVADAFPDPLLGLVSMGIELITLDPLIDALVKRSGAFSFTAFASSLQTSAIETSTPR